MLLNVGPTPAGTIAPEQADLLRAIGAWLAECGESIYGTRGGPFKPGDYGVSTRKGNTIYLHIREWNDDALQLPALPAQIVSSRVINGGRAEVQQTSRGVRVAVAAEERHPFDTIVALELDSSAIELPAVDVPAPVTLTADAKATASNVYQDLAQYGPGMAVDGLSDTRWATDSGVTSAWLELDLGRPVTFGRCVIKQAYPELQRVKEFAVEYWQDNQWIPCHRGKDLGARLVARFPAVTAQRVRLNISEATDGPTIWEFQLFE